MSLAERPAGSPLVLIHFGDLHLWRFGWRPSFFPKPLLGLANLALKRARRFPPAVAEALVGRLAQVEADFILFSGDLTTTALPAEFNRSRALFEPLMQSAGNRFIAIPGNHDRYTPHAARARLFEARFLHDDARSYPFARDLDDRWTLIGLDLSAPRFLTARGALDPAGLGRIGELLEEQCGRRRRLIVMGHYPLAYPPDVGEHWDHVLPGREQLLELLDRWGVELYLHGHKHQRWHLRRAGLTLLNCGAAGMLGTRPDRRPGYLHITLNDAAAPEVQTERLRPDMVWEIAQVPPHKLPGP